MRVEKMINFFSQCEIEFWSYFFWLFYESFGLSGKKVFLWISSINKVCPIRIGTVPFRIRKALYIYDIQINNIWSRCEWSLESPWWIRDDSVSSGCLFSFSWTRFYFIFFYHSEYRFLNHAHCFLENTVFFKNCFFKLVWVPFYKIWVALSMMVWG